VILALSLPLMSTQSTVKRSHHGQHNDENRMYLPDSFEKATDEQSDKQ
jgi:hypothetical protein